MPPEESESAAPVEPACILIVDDHEDNVELLRARLESWGFRTEAAADGQSVLDADVLVQPGWLYDMSGGPYCVVSLLTPEAELAEGLARVLRVVQSITHGA